MSIDANRQSIRQLPYSNCKQNHRSTTNPDNTTTCRNQTVSEPCSDCDSTQLSKTIQIRYKDADSKILELELSEDIGTFYLESIEAEKKNDRKNSRLDRHSQLSTFEYEDIRFFSDGTDLLADLIDSEAINHAMSCLNERQQYLIRKCLLEGWSYTDLAAAEGKNESAIRHAVDRAKKKLRKFLE